MPRGRDYAGAVSAAHRGLARRASVAAIDSRGTSAVRAGCESFLTFGEVADVALASSAGTYLSWQQCAGGGVALTSSAGHLPADAYLS